MIRGLYTAASGMLKGQKQMDIASNNLANASTNGYKKDIAVTQSFHEMLTKRINDSNQGQPSQGGIGHMSLGSDIIQVFTDYSQGQLIHTNHLTDMSIKNSDFAFFAVNVADEQGDRELYTRHGAFTVSQDGFLVTREGQEVLGLNGPIWVETDNFMVQEDGSIYAENMYVDTLKIIQFEDGEQLEKLGHNLVQSPEDAIIQPFSGQIAQGYVEGSNINTVEEMVQIISVMRAYEANQKVVKAYDETLGKLVNEVGKV